MGNRLTKLQFFLERLLGPADETKDNGESFFQCPECGRTNGKFHTLPVSQRFSKQWFKCLACDCWGSELDMCIFITEKLTEMRQAREKSQTRQYSRESLELFRSISDEWRTYKLSGKTKTRSNTRSNTKPGAIVSIPHVKRVPVAHADDEPRAVHGKADSLSIDDAFEQLTPQQIVTLALAFDTAEELGVDLYSLAAHCSQIVAWLRRKNADQIQKLMSSRWHMERCVDPDCDAKCCRIARGKVPLTDPEIEAYRERHKERLEEFGELAEGCHPAFYKRRLRKFLRESVDGQASKKDKTNTKEPTEVTDGI